MKRQLKFSKLKLRSISDTNLNESVGCTKDCDYKTLSLGDTINLEKLNGINYSDKINTDISGSVSKCNETDFKQDSLTFPATKKAVKPISKTIRDYKRKKPIQKNKLTFDAHHVNPKNVDMNVEHLEMAIALSKSVEDYEKYQGKLLTSSSQETVSKFNSTLDQYGFKSNKPKINGSSVIKKTLPLKSKFKFIKPSLFLITQEEREKCIHRKVKTIIEECLRINENRIKSAVDCLPKLKSKFQSNLIKEIYICPSTLYSLNHLTIDELTKGLFYNLETRNDLTHQNIYANDNITNEDNQNMLTNSANKCNNSLNRSVSPELFSENEFSDVDDNKSEQSKIETENCNIQVIEEANKIYLYETYEFNKRGNPVKGGSNELSVENNCNENSKPPGQESNIVSMRMKNYYANDLKTSKENNGDDSIEISKQEEMPFIVDEIDLTKSMDGSISFKNKIDYSKTEDILYKSRENTLFNIGISDNSKILYMSQGLSKFTNNNFENNYIDLCQSPNESTCFEHNLGLEENREILNMNSTNSIASNEQRSEGNVETKNIYFKLSDTEELIESGLFKDADVVEEYSGSSIDEMEELPSFNITVYKGTAPIEKICFNKFTQSSSIFVDDELNYSCSTPYQRKIKNTVFETKDFIENTESKNDLSCNKDLEKGENGFNESLNDEFSNSNSNKESLIGNLNDSLNEYIMTEIKQGNTLEEKLISKQKSIIIKSNIKTSDINGDGTYFKYLKCNSNKTPNNLIVKLDNVTPMDNYKEMDTPEINKELDKYGLKPIKRTRAVKMLEYIYNATHPQVGSDINKLSEIKNSKKPRKMLDENNYSDIQNNCIIPQENIEIKGDLILKDEKIDDLIFERKQSSKIYSCQLPLQIAWHNFISTQQQLCENILLYEPLHLNVIHQQFKDLGFKFHIEDLLTFLDRKCITIRTNQENGNKGRRKQV